MLRCFSDSYSFKDNKATMSRLKMSPFPPWRPLWQHKNCILLPECSDQSDLETVFSPQLAHFKILKKKHIGHNFLFAIPPDDLLLSIPLFSVSLVHFTVICCWLKFSFPDCVSSHTHTCTHTQIHAHTHNLLWPPSLPTRIFMSSKLWCPALPLSLWIEMTNF